MCLWKMFTVMSRPSLSFGYHLRARPYPTNGPEIHFRGVVWTLTIPPFLEMRRHQPVVRLLSEQKPARMRDVGERMVRYALDNPPPDLGQGDLYSLGNRLLVIRASDVFVDQHLG